MRTYYFLFPKMNMPVGGHLAQVRLMEAASSIVPTQAVTYQERYSEFPFLDDLLSQKDVNKDIFFVHWGPHVPELIQRLAGRHVVYAAYSTGYGFDIPAEVPVLAGSKHTQAYWGRHAPFSPIYHIPCIISEQFRNYGMPRPVDVLVQRRKNSSYVLNELVPQLQEHCTVNLLDDWVEDLAYTFNESKIYIYDSTDHWLGYQLSEGFGLPPLEAMACGCTVFSSINDALSDYLDPSFNCHQIHVYSAKYDVQRILGVLEDWSAPPQDSDPVANYRRPQVEKRLRSILSEIETFFDFRDQHREYEVSGGEVFKKNIRISESKPVEVKFKDRLVNHLRALVRRTLKVFRDLWK